MRSEKTLHKKAVVIHSGGMDSSLSLALAIKEFGCQEVLSVSFCYNQRHSAELRQSAKICQDWKVDHTQINIECLQEITEDSLTNHALPILIDGCNTNTLVTGRNGLMATLGAIHAHHLGAHCIYMGVIEVDGAACGYRDCTRNYMNLKQEILRIDLNDPLFEIRTPLVKMSKTETLCLAQQLGLLEYLLENTITCYEGLPRLGCQVCPSCLLRNKGLREFSKLFPETSLPYCLS